MTLDLVKTTDILESLGRQNLPVLNRICRGDQYSGAVRQRKAETQNCDLIVANDVTQAGAGFGTDTNSVHIFDAEGLVLRLPVMSKEEVAQRLLTLAADRLSGRSS